jgi:hypothetical protein
MQKGYEKENKDLILSLEPQVKDAKEKLSTHINLLREEYPLFAATRYPQPMDLPQTALKPGEWVLSYDVTDSGLLIYLTKGKELVKGLFKPIPRKEVDDLVRNFRESLEPAPGESIEKKLLAFALLQARSFLIFSSAMFFPNSPKIVP